jgi:hypothetical protein
MDLLIQKRETVAVTARPFTSDAERTSFERGIGEFVRFTSLTQKYTYDPANEPRARWQLPATVDVGRFTGYNIILIMLRSRTDEVFGLKAKRDDEHFELVQFDDNGVASYGRITAGDTISIGKSPLFLAYRWGGKTNGAPEGPG